MSYSIYKAAIQEIVRKMSEVSIILANAQKNEYGLTLESEKAKPQWQIAKLEYATLHKQLGVLNKHIIKNYPKEIKADRKRK